jgi:cell division protein FtsN
MEENNKVVIFEKKEIILVFIFVVVLIITSFTLGIRLGKKLGFTDSGIKEEDVKTVELKSTDEEEVEATVTEDSKLTDEEKLKKLMDESKNKLSEELQKFSTEQKVAAEPQANEATPVASKVEDKYTIQLGSYNTVEEAKQFAEGFTVRGYNPIINEVTIEGKGTWYRVSLGIFKTVDEAKVYIKKEQSLFSGQEHVISEIQ